MVRKNEMIIDIIPGRTCIPYEQMNIISNSQKLWLRFAFWIRSLIFSTFRDPATHEANLERLYYGVTQDFYRFFSLFYGVDIAQRFTELMSEIILSIWRVMEAVKNNDTERINTNTIQLYQNVDEIAKFFARINIYWDEAQWKNLLYQYIRMKIDEILLVAQEEFKKEIELYDRIEDITAVMGNYMARGIIASNFAAASKTTR